MQRIPTSSLLPTRDPVLVTGGSGFLGSWVIVELLRRGYRVRTTVRRLAREAEVREMVAGQVEAADRLTFVEADLLRDDGWTHAVDGIASVVHVASPMPIGEFRGQDVIRPAREGTLRVLTAAAAAGVTRVVLTSSSAAAVASRGGQRILNETHWTDLPDEPIYNYPRSKTLAEQDAWTFMKNGGTRMELVTILPSQIQGPVLGRDYSASVAAITMMLQGNMPAVPR
ncbi:MAG: NAD-dependent epimerase/dehydratase family protein, partial [Vicinamibacterales bacterium]